MESKILCGVWCIIRNFRLVKGFDFDSSSSTDPHCKVYGKKIYSDSEYHVTVRILSELSD